MNMASDPKTTTRVVKKKKSPVKKLVKHLDVIDLTGESDQEELIQDQEPNDLIAEENFSNEETEAPILQPEPSKQIARQTLSAPDKSSTPPPSKKPMDSGHYTLMVHFDTLSNKYEASCLELPEFKTEGTTRELALLELEDHLENHMMQARKTGTPLTEPFHHKKYPEALSTPVSQSTFRRLDLLSRVEKIAIDVLVHEFIVAGIEKRFEGSKSRDRNQSSSAGQNQPRHHNQQPQSNQGAPQQQRHGGRNNHRNNRHQNFQKTMENREDFMDYVRKLEKGGGTNTGGGWKKR